MLQSQNKRSASILWYWLEYLFMPWRVITRLRKENKRLEQIATSDPLTGALNRRGLESAFAREIGTLKRDHFRQGNEVYVSVFVIDLDHFKRLNDALGHKAGDEVLETVVMLLKKFFRRPTDIIARTGGDEFVVVLPETHPVGACWRMRKCLYEMRKDAQLSQGGIRVTASIGLASMNLQAGTDAYDSFETALLLADQAAYRSKERGRNRISIIR
jgi:diguanylate cyclase (GGDEF)-like protein